LGLAVGLITNGFLLNYLDEASHFEWVRVSLDAAGREQYRELKGVDGFDRVINNLMALAAAKGDAALGVGYVLTNRNDDLVRLEQLTLFLRKIGVDYIHFRPVVDHPELYSETRLDFLKKYETKNFSINIAPMNDNRDMGNRGLPCLAHSLSTVIAADGSVFLCGRLNRFDAWAPIGNVCQESFTDVWNSDERRRQVHMVSNADFCLAHCPQCRMTKYNRLLNDVQRVKTRNFI
jgi:radical SAM protein with 4Fe4S-binding SPASM domain